MFSRINVLIKSHNIINRSYITDLIIIVTYMIYITGQVRRTNLSLGDKLGIGIKEPMIIGFS